MWKAPQRGAGTVKGIIGKVQEGSGKNGIWAEF